jgi:hypothetical protein
MSGIKPRLHALLTSRFIMVEAGQSPGTLVAAAEASGTALITASAAALETVLLEPAPAAVAELLFFTILECLEMKRLRCIGGDGVGVTEV